MSGVRRERQYGKLTSSTENIPFDCITAQVSSRGLKANECDDIESYDSLDLDLTLLQQPCLPLVPKQ